MCVFLVVFSPRSLPVKLLTCFCFCAIFFFSFWSVDEERTMFVFFFCLSVCMCLRFSTARERLWLASWSRLCSVATEWLPMHSLDRISSFFFVCLWVYTYLRCFCFYCCCLSSDNSSTKSVLYLSSPCNVSYLRMRGVIMGSIFFLLPPLIKSVACNWWHSLSPRSSISVKHSSVNAEKKGKSAVSLKS